MLPKQLSDCFGASGIKTICRLVHDCKYPEVVRIRQAYAWRTRIASFPFSHPQRATEILPGGEGRSGLGGSNPNGGEAEEGLSSIRRVRRTWDRSTGVSLRDEEHNGQRGRRLRARTRMHNRNLLCDAASNRSLEADSMRRTRTDQPESPYATRNTTVKEEGGSVLAPDGQSESPVRCGEQPVAGSRLHAPHPDRPTGVSLCDEEHNGQRGRRLRARTGCTIGISCAMRRATGRWTPTPCAAPGPATGIAR